MEKILQAVEGHALERAGENLALGVRGCRGIRARPYLHNDVAFLLQAAPVSQLRARAALEWRPGRRMILTV